MGRQAIRPDEAPPEGAAAHRGVFERAKIGARAGFVTVLFTTTLNLLGRRLGVLSPAMDLREMSAPVVDADRHPSGALAAGIALHIASGAAEGAVFGVSVKRPSTRSGVAFMLVMWLVMMLVVMPLNGKGRFGLRDGVHVPVATLILHVVFGAVMGTVAAHETGEPPDPDTDR